MSGDEINVVGLLWGDPSRADGALRQRLCQAGVAGAALGSLGSAGLRPVVDERVSDVLRGALGEIDLGGILISAWTGYHALRTAARDSQKQPGRRVVVDLDEHEITSVHQPVVEILVNGTPAGPRLTFELVLTLTVSLLVAEVQHGRLVALRGGRVKAAAALELNGTPLARGERTWLPGAVVSLGGGIELTGGAAPAPTPPIPTPTASASPSWVLQVAASGGPAASGSPADPGNPAVSSAPVPTPSEVPWWERTAPAATRSGGDAGGAEGQRR